MSPAEAQAHCARTLMQGPATCPEGLFAGAREQVWRGLKVHANTISHARLVALEETFPRTRLALGATAFNALSRDYIEAGHGHARALASLGEDFPSWLAAQGAPPEAGACARFEWDWLASYHAAEAPPFTARALAEVGMERLGDLCLRPHPAARMLACSMALAAMLGLGEAGVAEPMSADNATWLLIARPEAEVLIYRADNAAAKLFALLPTAATFAEAYETFLAEPTNKPDEANKDALTAMHLLLTAGALTQGKTDAHSHSTA